MKYKKVTVGVLIGIITLSLAACSKKAENNSDKASQKESAKNMEFTDGLGKTITLDKGVPKKIVGIASSSPIIYSAVSGTSDVIVNTTPKALKTIHSGIYPEIFPNLTKIKSTAAGDDFVPNVEAVLSDAPDLVIQWGHSNKIIEPLERVGLKVAAWKCCTEEDRYNYVKMSGQISGKKDKADKIIAKMDNAKKDVKKAVTGIPKEKFKTMLEIDQLSGNSLRVVANSSQDYEAIALNSMERDSSGEWWKELSIEQVLKDNPDFIIIPSYATDLNPNDLYKNKLLSGLKAVKNKTIYKVPLFNRSPDNPELYLTPYWLGVLAYPDKFNGKEFPDKVKEAYDIIYDTKISDDQYKRVMEIEANSNSNLYAKTF